MKPKPKYQVLVAVEGQPRWYTDGEEFKTFKAAVWHRKSVAAKWSDCDTAISCGERVLAFQINNVERAEYAAIRAEERRSK